MKLRLAENRRLERALHRDWAKSPKLTAKRLTVIRSDFVGRGVIQYTAFDEWGDHPLGFMWIKEINSLMRTANVVHIFVNPVARRKGIATLIQDEVFNKFDRCISPHGTKEGEAWMRAYGYLYSEERGTWECDKPKKT